MAAEPLDEALVARHHFAKQPQHHGTPLTAAPTSDWSRIAGKARFVSVLFHIFYSRGDGDRQGDDRHQQKAGREASSLLRIRVFLRRLGRHGYFSEARVAAIQSL